MRAFHYNSTQQYPRLRAFTRATALVCGIAILGIGSIAQADTARLAAAAGATAEAVTVPVSGTLEVTNAGISGSRRSLSGPDNTRYIGMTRNSERQKIESIDPTSWLGQFGKVETLALR